MINKHDNTAKRHLLDNKVREDGSVEEGRLKVIRSDMKRATADRNCVKDLFTIDEHLK